MNNTAKICLVFIFNHRYDKNIEKLLKIYGSRFTNIIFLVPFYDGERSDVISVYESSYSYQGYIAQAASRLHAAGPFTHYVFLGDDLLLNPSLNENNLAEELKLDMSSSYIPNYHHRAPQAFSWWLPRWRDIRKFAKPDGFMDYRQMIPQVTEAQRVFASGGLGDGALKCSDYRLTWKRPAMLIRDLYSLLRTTRYKHLPYPLAMGYSDFIVVSSADFMTFARYCGVMAAMNIFVEIAIPTAMALACRAIVTETASQWRGLEVWSIDEGIKLIPGYGEKSVYAILDGFEPHRLHVHPVKLSRYDV